MNTLAPDVLCKLEIISLQRTTATESKETISNILNDITS